MQVFVFIFFAIAGVQLVYILVFLIAFTRRRPAGSGTPLPVSIIVCAHDEETNLKELIPQLLAQDYPEFEVVVVDDRSNDTTFDWLLEETKNDRRLRMVHVNRTPPHVNAKKYGITLGIKAARYEWILLTDADCRPAGTRWIASMSEAFETDKQFVLGYSPYKKMGGLLNAFIRFETLLTALQYFSFAWSGNPYMGVGRNMAYRRSMFLEHKGFNNFLNVTGGDDDLLVNQYANARNTGVVVGEESVIYSYPKTTFSAFFRQKIRHLSVGKLYKFKHRFLLGLFMFTWLLTWFAGIPLAILLPDFAGWIGGALLLRAVFLAVTLSVASKKLGQRFEGWLAPALDFIYCFYYLVTGLTALGSKKIRWKS